MGGEEGGRKWDWGIGGITRELEIGNEDMGKGKGKGK